jgi:hypothetical protein
MSPCTRLIQIILLQQGRGGVGNRSSSELKYERRNISDGPVPKLYSYLISVT